MKTHHKLLSIVAVIAGLSFASSTLATEDSPCYPGNGGWFHQSLKNKVCVGKSNHYHCVTTQYRSHGPVYAVLYKNGEVLNKTKTFGLTRMKACAAAYKLY